MSVASDYGLRALYAYDAETGYVSRRQNNRRGKAGERAGYQRKDRRREITYDGRAYPEHRVVWFLHYGRWPENDVDHINGDPSDNRIANLREATRSQNLANANMYANNKTGARGVARTAAGTFSARIQHQKKVHNLGTFNSLDEAEKAYKDAATRLFGVFALSART